MNLYSLQSFAPHETEHIGELLGKRLISADVVCLIGGLGAGKTAFTRGVGRGWGTQARVTSPTFTLINQYDRPQDELILFHLDCYRLTNDDDVETIGLEDILSADGAVVIEWPQVALGWLPDDRLMIEFELIDDESRQLTFSSSGPRSDELIDALKENVS